MNPYLVERLQPFGTTIFAEMSALAVATGAINLGQGFPDTDGPDVVKQAAIDAIEAGHNQYPPGIGIPELRTAIRTHQQRFYGLDYDADAEVLVTAGATEAIAAAMLGLCGAGDEVVMFEPYYDSYAACIAMAGATRRVVTLRAPAYAFDPDELRAAITARTKLILLNSPHNPTGKVFDRDELTVIAEIAEEHDLLVVTDEVYEHLVYDGEHIPLATLAGMRDRTVTIGSGGKTFSFTGWKVGWVCATPGLVGAVKTAKQFLTYVSSGPFQHAIAVGLQLPDEYFVGFRREMLDKRDRLCAGLHAAGFDVLRPQGTYFATVDIRSLGETDGLEFCRSLPHRCGVVAVPSVVFYDDVDAGAPLVRFACCKRTEVLDEACTRLKSLAVVIVAGIQHDIVWERPDENFGRLAPMIGRAAAGGARLVVLTEMFATGFSMKTDRVAEDVDGPSVQFLVEQARANSVWVCASLPERPDADEHPFNQLVVAGPDGATHRYAKIHPFTFGREHEHYSAGAHFLTVDIEDTRFSFFVCYDLRFADEFWALAPETDCYVLPANWPASWREHWMALLRARAIENQAYVVGVNRVGEGGRLKYAGDSMIVDPFGDVIARADDTEAIITAEVDAQRVREVRAEYPFLQDRR